MKNPLRITFVGRERPDLLQWIENPETVVIRVAGDAVSGLDVPIPGLVQAAGYTGAFSVADEMDRPCIVVGILARHASQGAPWAVPPAKGREDLASLGARTLQAAYDRGVHPDDVIGAGYRLYSRLRDAMAPPSVEAVQAAEGFSPGPTGIGSLPGSSSPSVGSTQPSDGSN